MSVEYEYVTIDVDIMSHTKACAAGVEAMGLWLWAMAWSHKNNADGRLPRHVIAIAWGASKQTLTKLAKSLVLAGLWVESPDGWEIWNYAKKNQLAQEKERRRALGRERMKRLRERKTDAPGDASPALLVTSRDAHVICQDAAPDPDPVLEVKDQSQEHERDRVAAEGGTMAMAMAPDSVASWWPGAVAAAEQVVGTIPDPGALWVEYDAARYRKGWAKNHRDAVGWLTSVRRSAKERAAERPAPKSSFRRPEEITKQPYDPNAPWMKAGES